VQSKGIRKSERNHQTKPKPATKKQNKRGQKQHTWPHTREQKKKKTKKKNKKKNKPTQEKPKTRGGIVALLLVCVRCGVRRKDQKDLLPRLHRGFMIDEEGSREARALKRTRVLVWMQAAGRGVKERRPS